ncbi:hypothetical protein NF867_17095 [Solitalea sp. MAHUQ-68]|uniref:Damage-inducible protein DinB n=1 Tax=Solitalea agri TaxID=2953739 RepID=A0A9X2F4I9_9SPHI|nr:DinB family protein [Solitalea agri]MCO4294582.1 hypothetical protein [Solitalea agri]
MKAYFQRLYEYENWANGRIIETLKKLDTPPDRSLLLLAHLLIAQREWLHRILKKSTTDKFWLLYDLEQSEELFKKNNEEWSHFFLTIQDDDLTVPFHYKNSKGEQFDSPMVDILTHLLGHSNYHRGQIIDSIKGLIEPLPNTDFIVFSRNP